MYSLYQTRLKEYQTKYGPKTTVFLQVGSFYELYEIQDPTTGETTSNTKEVADSIDLQFAVHKGEAPGGLDGLVAGFPDYALHKWAAKLTSQGYTVAVIDQQKNARGQVTERSLARILSPSTHVEAISSTITPYTTVIYFNAISTSNSPQFGVASLDLTTGQTTTFMGQTQGRSETWTADALVQHLTVLQPREIIIYWHSAASSPLSPPKNLIQLLSIPSQTSTLIREISSIGTFANSTASSEYLRKQFNIRSLLPPTSYLHLTDMSSPDTTALLYLCQFIEEHLPSQAANLTKNTPWRPNQQLICGNHALTQLQITSQTTPQESLLSLFTSTATPMGKRGIASRLLRPLSDSARIQERLDQIRQFISLPSDTRKAILSPLRLCRDLPRLHHRVQTATIDPADFSAIQQTYSSVDALMSVPGILSPPFSEQAWSVYKSIWISVIDQTKAFTFLQTREDLTPYNPHTFSEIETIETSIQTTKDSFEKERKAVARAARLSEDSLRLEAREKEPFGIKATKAQMAAIKLRRQDLPKDTELTELKSNGWVETPALAALNRQLLKERQELAQIARSTLLQVCQRLSEAGQTIWTQVEDWLTLLDVTQTLATTAEMRGWSYPVIHPPATEETPSSVKILGLRHPLVEATNSRVNYVQHDIQLGSTDSENGMLIYGMNASGKSTLMKAVGIAVLLAQAGCYVPARSMELTPFTAIYTRILNQDNIFAGLSSFAVEMSELRDILRAADHRSLVLGDELCAGTESTSAEALVAAGIKWLANVRSKFIFATHLHHLPALLSTAELNLAIYHLHVAYDPLRQKLVYDRELRPGPGSSLYGLEVARAMDLPLAFIEEALTNRHKILGTTRQEDAGTSQYNANVVLRACELCGKGVTGELEVHHIEPQKLAKSGVLLNGKNVHSAANLITICAKCHDAHHAGQLPISPLLQTSDGYERSSTTTTETRVVATAAGSKWSEEEREQIKEVLAKYSQLSLKAIQGYLKNNYNISISTSTLSQFRKN